MLGFQTGNPPYGDAIKATKPLLDVLCKARLRLLAVIDDVESNFPLSLNSGLDRFLAYGGEFRFIYRMPACPRHEQFA